MWSCIACNLTNTLQNILVQDLILYLALIILILGTNCKLLLKIKAPIFGKKKKTYFKESINNNILILFTLTSYYMNLAADFKTNP